MTENTPVNSLALEPVAAPQTVQHNFQLPIQVDQPRFKHMDDPIHTRMGNHPLYGKRIQLRSVHGKTGQPVHIEPTHVKGRDTVWLGIPRLTAEQQQKMYANGYSLAVPGESFIDIPDGFDIDLGTEEGLYLWEWIEPAPQIVTLNDQFDPDKPHEGADKELFIIIPSEEIEKRAKSFTNRSEAALWIQSLSPLKWYDIARVIGSGMDGGSPLDLFNYLMDVAEKTPERLLKLKTDNQFDQKLLIRRLLDAGIMQQGEGGYRYNNVFLGTSEEQVIHYMAQDKHGDIVSYMRSALGVNTGLGNVPVPRGYASYNDEPEPVNEVIRNQAAQGSSVAEKMKQLSQQRLENNSVTNIDNDDSDLDDDYSDEGPGDNDGVSLNNLPDANKDTAAGTVAVPTLNIPTKPGPGRPRATPPAAGTKPV